MDSISSILPRVLAKRGFKKEATASLITSRANVYLRNHDFPENVRATKCQDGVLVIVVQSAILAQECQMCSHDLQGELQKEFPNDVRSIRIIRD